MDTEDGFEYLFDPNDEGDRIFQKFRKYYNVQTSEYRESMLKMNVSTPKSILEASFQPRQEMISKNLPTKTSIEEKSEEYRNENLRRVINSSTNLQEESDKYRKEMLKKNGVKSHDILSSSSSYRDSMLSKNTPRTSDIKSESVDVRDSMISKIVTSTSDIESESVDPRNSMLSKIVTSESDIESESVNPRNSMLSKIVASTSDIESESVDPRDSMLSKIVTSTSDIESESVGVRDSMLSKIVTSESDIESESVGVRNSMLSKVVPSTSDIESESVDPRNSMLSKIVTSESDIESESINPRNSMLSKIVPSTSDIESDSVPHRADDLSNNIASESDIETDSVPHRADDLSNNIASESDIETDSIPHRTDDLSNNVASESDIETDSVVFRDGDLSNNTPSTSDVLTDSIPYRTAMLTKNGNAGLIGINIQGLGTSAFIGVSRNYTLGILVRNILQTRNKYTPRNPYNLSGADDNSQIYKGEYEGIRGKSVKKEIEDQIKKGSDEFVRGTPTPTYTTSEFPTKGYWESDLENGGQMNKTTAGNPSIGFYDNNKKGVRNLMDSIVSRGTKLTENYNPKSKEFSIGSEGVVARKRYTIENPYFSNTNYGKKESGKLIFSITNYAIPNTSDFRTMFFPPYIQSFQETSNANWNSHDFLGRPEPVYTYNNSTRGGSITFFVLTDYAQEVEVGTDWTSSSMDKILFNSKTLEGYNIDESKSFTERYIKDDDYFTDKTKTQSDIAEKKEELKGYNEEVSSMMGTNTLSDFVGSKFIEMKEKLGAITKEIDSCTLELSRLTDHNARFGSTDQASPGIDPMFYSEKSHISESLGKNTEEFHGVKRLSRMKENLQFQPAFFSGDKIDFERKMSFIQRTTRPRGAKLSDQQGFSFTKPPVCHIKLGDWLNHDCIITDVSIDYTDSMWGLEEGETQPMWASVTMGFHIIGQWGDNGGGNPLTASDSEGYYTDNTKGKASIEVGKPQGEFL